MADAPNDASTPVLLRALRMLLRPLARLLLARQIPYPTLTALLKEVYVDVAENEFRLPDKRQTDSRVSLLTGIHRKEVSRLRSQPVEEADAPRSVSLGAQIVSRWLAVDDYLDDGGRPRPLPRQSPEAGGPSFESLVQSVSKDIRPRAVLDEWLRLGIAHVDDDRCVRLNTDSFVAEQGFEEKAYYFGRNLRDHIAAGVHNLSGERPPLVDRSVYYARLSPESIREIATLAEQLGMDALRAVNRRALELQERDAASPGEQRRFNFGIYFFEAALESGRVRRAGDEQREDGEEEDGADGA